MSSFLSIFVATKNSCKNAEFKIFKKGKFLNLSKNETKIMLEFQIQKRSSKRNKMKKLVLVALLGLGAFVAGCATATNEKTTAKTDKATKANAENLSKEQLIDDCVKNENESSCQRLINSGSLASVEQCDKESCSNIGLVYSKIQNYQQAFKYFKKACELNSGYGCGNLSILYYNGRGVKQNFAEAFKFAKKACDLNLMTCYNVGFYYTEGKGVRQDFVNARKYWEKACNANDAMACNNVGVLYYNGQGVKQNLSTAKEYYGKACDLGNQTGCDNYRVLNEQGVK